MTTLIAFMPAAFMMLAGIGIGANRLSKQESEAEQRTELTQDMVNACTDACSQVAVVNGIDSAEALCGAYGVEEPFSDSYTYGKCVKPEAVEGVTAEATKIIGDFTSPLDKKVFYDVNSRETVCDSEVETFVDNILVSRAMEHGLDMNFARTELSQDRCFSTEEEFIGPARVSLQLNSYGRDLEHALFNVKRVINGGAEHWNNRRACEWLTGLFGAKPFCEANKDFPDCKQFLDIYGKCERILADAANKNEL